MVGYDPKPPLILLQGDNWSLEGYVSSVVVSAGRSEATIQEQALVKTKHLALEHDCLGIAAAV